jgi:N-acetylmuramoyl-L-alanine amidase
MGDRATVTRRVLLGRVAAVGAASLLAPELARAATSSSAVYSRWVGRLAGDSAPIVAPRRFALVGIEWSGPAGPHIELRARGADRRWSAWVPASVQGHDPDGARDSARLFGEPVWTGPADAVQLHSAGSVNGVRLHFVRARGPAIASSATLPLAQPILDTGPGQPPVIARAGWARGQAPPGGFVGYGTVKLAFVHHTVSPNGYSTAAVPALLRAIFDYHRYVRRYFDIAYNFLIDRYGRIWEGRAGGIDMAVVGAHAGGYNAESTGVAMLGDFMDVVPPPQAMHALEQLLAWKLSLHGVPARGRTTAYVDPATAFYTPFAPGALVSLPHIAGHRDGDLTDCPGNALYARLPAVRSRVAGLAGNPARLRGVAAPSPAPAGTKVTFGGSLALFDGTPLADAPIEIQELTDAGAVTRASVPTAQDGSWSFPIGREHTFILRALHRSTPAAVCDWVEIDVKPIITLGVQSTAPLRVGGSIVPVKPKVTIDLYKAGRLAKPFKQRQVQTADGSFATTFNPPPGSYVLIARHPADTSNAAAASPPVSVTI